MVKWAATAFLALTAVVGMVGCGTYMNLEDRPTGYFRPKGCAMKRVYGGTRIDAEWGSRYFAWNDDWLFGAMILTIDLPLSFVADTVTLPWTIPMAFRTDSKSSDLEKPSDTSPPKTNSIPRP